MITSASPNLSLCVHMSFQIAQGNYLPHYVPEIKKKEKMHLIPF